MSIANQIHEFLEISETFLGQPHAWVVDDTLPLSMWPREGASKRSDGQLTALSATRRLETPVVSAAAGETGLTIERNF